MAILVLLAKILLNKFKKQMPKKNLKFPVTFLVMGSLSIKEAKWFALCELISMT